MKPKTTFTVLSQPPDFGNFFIISGKNANSVNGIANANEKPNIAVTGFKKLLPAVDSTKTEPTIGPVQEKLTKTKTNAKKKTPIKPPLSPRFSALLIILDGITISNMPRNESANTKNIIKNITFGNQCVLSVLKILAVKFSPPNKLESVINIATGKV